MRRNLTRIGLSCRDSHWVCGGSQSFNAVNQLHVLDRWMRMVTIPNHS
jgi:hypothetical protein